MTSNSVEGLYNDPIKFMEFKGIKFDSKYPENDFISKNHVFKLYSYTRNFKTDGRGVFFNINFDDLKRVAVLDTIFREYILNLSLAIEHSIITYLINFLNNNYKEDEIKDIFINFSNYSFEYNNGVKNNVGKIFFNNFKNNYLSNYNIEDYFKIYNISRISENSDPKEIIDKIPFWLILEKATSGQIKHFIDFMSRNVLDKQPSKLRKILMNMSSLNRMRNSSAHNSPILDNIYDFGYNFKNPNNDNKNRHVPNYISQIRKNRNIKLSKPFLASVRMNDLFSVFYLSKILLSNESKRHFTYKSYHFINDLEHVKFKNELKFIDTFKKDFISLINNFLGANYDDNHKKS